MSFTIKCNKCGYEKTFDNITKNNGTILDIEIDHSSSDYGAGILSINAYCGNSECDNYVEVN